MQVLSEPNSSRLLQSPKCYFTKRNINQLGEIQRWVQTTLAIPQGNLGHMTWDVYDITRWHVHFNCFYCLTGVRCGHLFPFNKQEGIQGCEAEGIHSAIWPVFCWDKCVPGTHRGAAMSCAALFFTAMRERKKIFHCKPRISVRFPRAFHLGCCRLCLLPDNVPTGLIPPSPLQRSSPLPQRHYSKLMKVVEAKRTRVCYFWSVTR